ncbi:lycopene cyclase family protein [Flavobacteriaceae bacterium 3-367]|uniref:lycopene cyclase family protein n=1 Tax=Eudoraea algarum TaxID=3417568 RepID=UPI003287B0CA
METYDYIIIGAGAAGLMLADALGSDPFFAQKSILLLDKDAKRTNDRTWCFWEKERGPFDDILYATWDHINFGGKDFHKTLAIKPYVYKMLRGVDFYRAHLERIGSYPNLRFAQETVTQVEEVSSRVRVHTEDNTYVGTKVFNSILDFSRLGEQSKFPVLQQHFEGWFVKAKQPIFTEDRATFMDFSVPQKGNTRFMYLLPFSATEALVEYTLFSEQLLPNKEYGQAIETYLRETLHCTSYEVLFREKGSIPMSCYDFAAGRTQNMLPIGTAGGWSKASTGYTFRNTYKKTTQLVAHLKAGKSLDTFGKKARFWYYDLILLDVLHHDNGQGRLVFESLFKKRTPQQIFKFLDEETHLGEELRVISAAPTWAFIKALFRRLF